MIQEIIAFIIIFAAVFYTIFSIIKSIIPKKRVANNGMTCSSKCSGCTLSDICSKE